MRLLARLEYEPESCASWYVIFRQSPKLVRISENRLSSLYANQFVIWDLENFEHVHIVSSITGREAQPLADDLFLMRSFEVWDAREDRKPRLVFEGEADAPYGTLDAKLISPEELMVWSQDRIFAWDLESNRKSADLSFREALCQRPELFAAAHPGQSVHPFYTYCNGNRTHLAYAAGAETELFSWNTKPCPEVVSLHKNGTVALRNEGEIQFLKVCLGSHQISLDELDKQLKSKLGQRQDEHRNR